MTEATKRPWYATGIHVQSAATNEDNYVCTAEGDTPEAAIENANLIVKAGNSHDALVAALEAVEWVQDPSTRDVRRYCPSCDEFQDSGHVDCQLAAALEQVK
jgi:hypothetical protein